MELRPSPLDEFLRPPHRRQAVLPLLDRQAENLATAFAAGVGAELRCPVELAVFSVDQRRIGQLTVRAVEVVQHSQRTAWGNLEDRAEVHGGQWAATVAYRSSHRKWRQNVERILVIYDGPGSRWTVREILKPAGYDVTTAACGRLSMDVILTTNPGLVILDICLPGTLTHDLCRRIRSKSRNVPLLVLSIISDVEQAVLLLQLGADGYITKPFSSLEFLARVRAAMRHFGTC
jgi:CheY-like chemotaxis protein